MNNFKWSVEKVQTLEKNVEKISTSTICIKQHHVTHYIKWGSTYKFSLIFVFSYGVVDIVSLNYKPVSISHLIVRLLSAEWIIFIKLILFLI